MRVLSSFEEIMRSHIVSIWFGNLALLLLLTFPFKLLQLPETTGLYVATGALFLVCGFLLVRRLRDRSRRKGMHTRFVR
jgi:hypothetical protein